MSDEADGPTSQATLGGETPEELTADDLIVSAHQARNEDVFPKVLDLHVDPGAKSPT